MKQREETQKEKKRKRSRQKKRKREQSPDVPVFWQRKRVAMLHRRHTTDPIPMLSKRTIISSKPFSLAGIHTTGLLGRQEFHGSSNETHPGVVVGGHVRMDTGSQDKQCCIGYSHWSRLFCWDYRDGGHEVCVR